MDERELLRQIDCLRPDGRDAEPAELGRAAHPRAEELFARGAAFDRRMLALLHGAPLPSGLEGRLLAAVAAAEVDVEVYSASNVPALASVSPAAIFPAPKSPAASSRSTRRINRRRWAFACGGIAAAAIVGLGVWTLLPPTFTEAEVRERALTFYLQDVAAASAPPAPSLPFSRQVAIAPRAARRVDGFLSQTAAAFDLQTRSGARATLYVAQLSVAGLSAAPPPRLGPATGRQAVVAWQEGELLYVLVVEGGEREYQQFIHAPTIA